MTAQVLLAGGLVLAGVIVVIAVGVALWGLSRLARSLRDDDVR